METVDRENKMTTLRTGRRVRDVPTDEEMMAVTQQLSCTPHSSWFLIDIPVDHGRNETTRRKGEANGTEESHHNFQAERSGRGGD